MPPVAAVHQPVKVCPGNVGAAGRVIVVPMGPLCAAGVVAPPSELNETLTVPVVPVTAEVVVWTAVGTAPWLPTLLVASTAKP